MAYDAPTSAEIKARFPEFAAVADATVDAIIEEAGLFVDETWLEEYFKPAQMFYVAHELLMAGQGTSAAAKISQIGDFQRIKSGDLEVSRGAQSSGSSSSGNGTFPQSKYGVKFLELRSLCFPAFLSI